MRYLINNLEEIIKTWSIYLSSSMVGAIGTLDLINRWLDLIFVLLGIAGLILSIILTLKKIKAFNNKP